MRRAKWKSRGIVNLDEAVSLYENKSYCEICSETDSLHLDHCHNSGVARGILCANCNRGLGLFKDDTDRLQRAIDYLGKVVYNN